MIGRLILGLSVFALVSCAPKNEVSLDDARIQWVPGNGPLAGYFELRNYTDAAIMIEAISAEGFQRAMMHRSVSENGVNRMEHLSSVSVEQAGILVFEPGGLHLMMIGRPKTIAVGASVTVQFQLSGGSVLTHAFDVQGLEP